MIIRTSNSLTIGAERTFLTGLVPAGTNVLPWKNATGFSPSWAIQLGETGEEQTEILVLSASTPSGTAGTTTGNSLYEHPADTPIYAIKYNQIVFERSTSGTAGTASPMSNGTVGIMADGTATLFDDTTGATTYAYKTYFRNSVSAGSSAESVWITPQGFPFYSLAKLKQRVKDKLTSAQYLNGFQVDDYMITDWLNEYLEMMTNAAIDVNEDYNMGTMQLVFTDTQELGTVTATDFKGGFKRVWYADGGGTYIATKMDSNSFSPNKTFTATFPYFYMQGDSVIGRRPADNTGTLILEYPKMNPVLVDDTDQIPVPMQGYTKGFIDYSHSQALFKDQKIEESQVKENSAMGVLGRFKIDISPRNRTGSTYVDIVEDTGSDSEYGLW